MNNTTNKLVDEVNILLNCDPEHCRYYDCPFYLDELHKCDADRQLDKICAIIKDKYKNTNTYNCFSKG